MSRTTWVRNTAVMVAHAQRRKQQALGRVDAAIATFRCESPPVNFNTVAREAGVTTSTQYLCASTSMPPAASALAWWGC